MLSRRFQTPFRSLLMPGFGIRNVRYRGIGTLNASIASHSSCVISNEVPTLPREGDLPLIPKPSRRFLADIKSLKQIFTIVIVGATGRPNTLTGKRMERGAHSRLEKKGRKSYLPPPRQGLSFQQTSTRSGCTHLGSR